MTFEELSERQSWTLDQKIDHSLGTIDKFYRELNGKVYISFSGGKDSTVLYWLARKIYPDIKAVFCNTGNEYPDIVKFVRGLKNNKCLNIEIIHPKIRPQDVLSKYGFPLVSKDVSEHLKEVRMNPKSIHSLRAMGLLTCKYDGKIPEKYKFLLVKDYLVSSMCCHKLKKEPFRKYERVNGEAAILGIMASESRMRKTMYINRGGV